MNSNIILMITIIIVLLTIFTLFYSSCKENFDSNTSDSISSTKSIVSKIHGKMINIKLSSNNSRNNIIYIPSPLSSNNNLAVNTNTMFVEELKNSLNTNQQFKLLEIENQAKLTEYTGIQGSTSSCVGFPFYIVESRKFDNLVLSYNGNNLILVLKSGIDDNCKWDLSNYKIPSMSICTNNIINTSYGSITENNNNNDIINDNIKININLKDDIRRKLFGSNNEANLNNNNSCDNVIHKDAISSICPGCDTNNF